LAILEEKHVKSRFLIAVLMLGALVLPPFRALAAADPDAAAVADGGAATTLPAAGVPVETQVARLKSSGVDQALGGHFDQALKEVQAAAKLSPHDKLLSDAQNILSDYLTAQARAEADRAGEYADAVRRVKSCLLAQAWTPKLKESGVLEKMHKKWQEIVTAYNRNGLGDAVETASQEKAQQLKDQSADNVKTMLAAMDELTTLFKDDSSEYGTAMAKTIGQARESLAAYGKGWAAVDAASDKGRHAGARNLRALEDAFGDSMSDLETLATEEPWRIAIIHAMTAKQMASPGDKVPQQDWWKAIVADLTARGKAKTDKADWYEALSAYSGLAELDNDSLEYKQKVKDVQRHVRVLGLYGKGGATSKPAVPAAGGAAADTQPDDRINWQEMVSGIDVDMVKKVIEELDELYVSPVDYRKLAHGAMNAVKVLVETPQAGDSFESLKDESKRKAFLDAINQHLDKIDKQDRVDHLDLQLAVNQVMRASDRSIELSPAVLAMEFTDGMLDELDPFSNMIWPYDVTDFNKSTLGKFCGVGVQIGKEKGEPLKVATPLPDSPAYKAGIKVGDLILEVDGTKTIGLNVDKLVRMITGEEGTKVRLTIQRSGIPKPFDVELTREEIKIRTIKGWLAKPDGGWDYRLDAKAGIGYIRMTQFTEETHNDIAKAMEDAKKAGVTSFVIDLRFNPGGLLRQATDVANEFITPRPESADRFMKEGRIVSTQGRSTKPSVIDAVPGGMFLDGNLVVLVNQYSASAAEILSGALQDWHRAVIVGERSYGKGSVQNIIPIKNGAAFLKLTTAHYYLPNGRLLHREPGSKDWGVDPDVGVLLTPKQRKHWLDVRHNTDLIQDVDPAELQTDLKDQYDSDMQLQTGVMLLKLMQLRGGVAQADVAAHN
jgi:carboxyl-terminal processing protease